MKYFSVGVIVVVFLLAGFLSGQYSDFFVELLDGNRAVGMLSYFFLTILAIVVAPLTSIPLIPIIVSVWGVFWSVTLSVAGWFAGSMIAFGIARKFGAPVVDKLAFVKDKKDILADIPEQKLFWYLILLRVTVPVDILSYALGLFTNVGWKLFAVTTLIGITPVIVILAQAGKFPIQVQILLVGLAVLLLVAGWLILKKKKSRN